MESSGIRGPFRVRRPRLLAVQPRLVNSGQSSVVRTMPASCFAGLMIWSGSMPFFAFPRSTILVERVVGANGVEASVAKKCPVSIFLVPDSIKRVGLSIAALARFLTAAFDFNDACSVRWSNPVDRRRGSGEFLRRFSGCNALRASSTDPVFVVATT